MSPREVLSKDHLIGNMARHPNSQRSFNQEYHDQTLSISMEYPYFQTKSISWATETTTARCNFAPQPQVYWASPTAAACSAPATPSFGVGMGATSTCTADVLGSNSSNEVSMAMRGMKTVPWIHGFFQFFNEHSNIDQGSKFRGTVLENCMYCGPKGISSCLDVWSSHRAVVEPWLNHLSCTKESPPCFKWIQTWGYTHIHQTIPSFHQTFIASHFYISSNVIHHIPKKMQ